MGNVTQKERGKIQPAVDGTRELTIRDEGISSLLFAER
jgi:hypothetical protein